MATGKIYETQPIEVEILYSDAVNKGIFVNPDEITSVEIEYSNGETSGVWTAVHDKPNKKFYYLGGSSSSYGVTGRWTFLALVTLQSGKTYPTTPISEIIYKKGT